ncbi:MAG: helix-turn-helix transcriptional regulator [Terracidiphilus sp.]
MDWKKELGIQIREARRDSLLSQGDLGRRAHVHINMIGRYEQGDSAPELDVLIELAIALNIEKLRIGKHSVIIKVADGVEVPSGVKQLRLEFDKEYVVDGGGSRMKIRPTRDGLFIVPEKRKAG